MIANLVACAETHTTPHAVRGVVRRSEMNEWQLRSANVGERFERIINICVVIGLSHVSNTNDFAT